MNVEKRFLGMLCIKNYKWSLVLGVFEPVKKQEFWFYLSPSQAILRCHLNSLANLQCQLNGGSLLWGETDPRCCLESFGHTLTTHPCYGSNAIAQIFHGMGNLIYFPLDQYNIYYILHRLDRAKLFCCLTDLRHQRSPVQLSFERGIREDRHLKLWYLIWMKFI